MMIEMMMREVWTIEILMIELWMIEVLMIEMFKEVWMIELLMDDRDVDDMIYCIICIIVV